MTHTLTINQARRQCRALGFALKCGHDDNAATYMLRPHGEAFTIYIGPSLAQALMTARTMRVVPVLESESDT